MIVLDTRPCRDKVVIALAAEIEATMLAQVLADGDDVSTGHWIALSMKCGACRKWWSDAMPEDCSGASCTCTHCGADQEA